MYQYNAKLIKVIDGDTVDVAIDVGFDISIKHRLRMQGINAPERGADGYEAARAALFEATANYPLVVTTYKDKREKYGRYLADIKVIGTNGVTLTESVSQYLLGIGLVKPYV